MRRVKGSTAKYDKDNERLRLIRQFDEKAAGKFVDELSRKLKRYLRGKVSNYPTQALDLALQVLVIYHGTSDLILNCGIMTHATKVAKNLYINELRKVINQKTHPEPPEYFNHIMAEDNIYEYLEVSELKLAVHNCIKTLPERCQRIIRLFLEGVSAGQVTESMGYSSTRIYQVRKSECMDKLEHAARNSRAIMELME